MKLMFLHRKHKKVPQRGAPGAARRKRFERSPGSRRRSGNAIVIIYSETANPRLPSDSLENYNKLFKTWHMLPNIH